MIVVIGGLLAAAGVVLIIYSNLLMDRVVREVNSNVPLEQRIGAYWIRFNVFQIMSQHRVLFPLNGKRRQMVLSAFLGIALVFIGYFVAVAALFGRQTN